MYKFRIVEILFLSAISSAVFGNIVLENEYVKYEFAGTNGGLVSMIDKSSSTEHMHVNSDDAMLWSLVMGNNGQYSSKYYTVAASPIVTEMDGTKRLDMTWAIGNISVMVKAVLANNTGIAAFRIFVNNNSDAALKNVKFHLNGFISSGDYDVAHPYDNIGYLHKNLTSGFTSTYPCGFNAIMQFCIFIKSNSTSGIYFAAEDPQAMYKIFEVVPGGNLSIDTLVENANVQGSDFAGPYPIKLGVFQGNWIDGCKIYRRFALTAPWAAKGKLSQRTSMPQNYKDIGLWMRYGDTRVDPNKTTAQNNAELYAAQNYFSGIPLGINYYFWHNNAFDHDLPNYLPAKPGYPEVFSDLVSRGWLVEPYINNRVITEGNLGSYQGSLATKADGTYYVEFYAENSYVVCPYASGWQNKIAALCSDILNLGANGIYLDQLSATAVPCYNTAHGHPAGGGGHWASGYRNMLNKIKNDAHNQGRTIAVSGEFTNEINIAGSDSFLLWSMSLRERAIPMFPAVYSGYTLIKGSNALTTWTDPAWRMYVGRLFLWGVQCGWMVPSDVIAAPTKGSYLRAIGLYRVMAREYLTYGELVELLSGADNITVQWLSSTATLPAIQGTLWKSENGNLAVLLSNFDSSPRSINLCIDTRKYIPGKVRQLDITKTTNRGTTFVRNEQNGICTFSRTLLSGDIEFLEIKPTPLQGDINGDQKVNFIDFAIFGGQWIQ